MKLNVFFLMFSLASALFAESPVTLKNRLIEVSVDPSTAAFSVTDLRSGQVWNQTKQQGFRLENAKRSGKELRAVLCTPDNLKLDLSMELSEDVPELKVVLSGAAQTPVSRSIAYPLPFVPNDSDIFILPEHEGAGIPVRDYMVMNPKNPDGKAANPVYSKQFRFYSGHDLSMTFWGYAGEKSSCMSIVETPNDASLRVQSIDGVLVGGMEWESSHQVFGYSRAVRYVFFEEGGYNAICKRYRKYAFEAGLLKTLEEKSKTNPNVMKFARSALVWIFSADVSVLAPKLREAGMENLAVTSPMLTPGDVQRMNSAGTLNGVYDCVRSVLETQYMDKVFRMDPCDVRGALPENIVVMKNGKPFDWGWPKNGPDNKVYRTMDVCDSKQLEFARNRLDEHIKNRPMSVRFYDTLAAFPWTECYDPRHPTTRSQVREARMSILKYAAEDRKQVVGSESGHIYAAPYATYFEGMNHCRFFYYELKGHPLFIYDSNKELPENFVTGRKIDFKYRLPLLELVAHDCLVTHPRWNQPNNKIHRDEWWDSIDLWDILYGTPPMYTFINEPLRFWETYKARYQQSYSNVVEKVLVKVAGQEMTEHRYLTDDKSVQKTAFVNGVEVIVNFGEKAFKLPDGSEIAAGGFKVNSASGN